MSDFVGFCRVLSDFVGLSDFDGLSDFVGFCRILSDLSDFIGICQIRLLGGPFYGSMTVFKTVFDSVEHKWDQFKEDTSVCGLFMDPLE